MKRSLLAILLFAVFLSVAGGGSAAELSSAIRKLTLHAEGRSPLSAADVNGQAAIVLENMADIGTSPRIIQEAFGLVAAYDEEHGPLFMNRATRNGFPRKPAGGLELERAVFAVQQGLIDHAYTSDNLQKHARLFDGLLFGTSAYFPGAVKPPENKGSRHRVAVNASQPSIAMPSTG